ncbi:short-chain fatty acyl-CoA regulator family protein [Gordonia insulae]|uniref:HTH-type transcriptional regulator PrpR n=1 Tax=Gordonia insulae TaxID=2420509 RepID=A0A3G8JK06_9ACTN|nr:short-chain fatty acyl-CoA regulator family protein [Gordonia insulae]AZG44862.1 HTH-type transcriptional regulator PrpR [Gordonia insulae]
MAKMFVGARLRRLRDERGLSQAALARRIDLSTSYVNQLENDQRPITVPVLLALSREFDLDADYFAADGDARLVADLADVLAAQPDTPDVSRAEIAELVARMPAIGSTLVNLHRRLTAADSELESYRAQATGDPGRPASTPMPFEEVRDFFYDRRNHIDALDTAAEQIFADNGLSIGGLDLQLGELLARDHGIRVAITHDTDPHTRAVTPKRRFDAAEAVVHLAGRLSAGQRAFQLATQLALLTQADVIDDLVADADDLSPESIPVARIGLANYFAGALLLPYEIFRRAAESARYDIELLSIGFEVGFETVCHRLSTLQRPGSRGIPFIFVRVDRAGNISKRQSATAFHFSRVGGSCPLWVVHDAFATPGRIATQVSSMPDGRSYFWLARTTVEPSAYLAPDKSFAIGLGCDVAHAERLVYSTGVNLADPRTVVPIGAGCKVCDRPACPQRAFPQLGRPIHVDPGVSDSVPYRPMP